VRAGGRSDLRIIRQCSSMLGELPPALLGDHASLAIQAVTESNSSPVPDVTTLGSSEGAVIFIQLAIVAVAVRDVDVSQVGR